MTDVTCETTTETVTRTTYRTSDGQTFGGSSAARRHQRRIDRKAELASRPPTIASLQRDILLLHLSGGLLAAIAILAAADLAVALLGMFAESGMAASGLANGYWFFTGLLLPVMLLAPILMWRKGDAPSLRARRLSRLTEQLYLLERETRTKGTA